MKKLKKQSTVKKVSAYYQIPRCNCGTCPGCTQEGGGIFNMTTVRNIRKTN